MEFAPWMTPWALHLALNEDCCCLELHHISPPPPHTHNALLLPPCSHHPAAARAGPSGEEGGGGGVDAQWEPREPECGRGFQVCMCVWGGGPVGRRGGSSGGCRGEHGVCVGGFRWGWGWGAWEGGSLLAASWGAPCCLTSDPRPPDPPSPLAPEPPLHSLPSAPPPPPPPPPPPRMQE